MDARNPTSRACAQKEPLKVQPPTPPPETVELPELPFDVIPLVLRAIFDGWDDRDPEATCRTAARWCAVNRAHRDACRDDDAAWRAITERVFPAEDIAELDDPRSEGNWFGEWPHKNYENFETRWDWRPPDSHGLRPDAFDTPRAFFYALCDQSRRRRMTPIWDDLAGRFADLPRDYPDYFEIAKLAAALPSLGLEVIPTDMPGYGAIARWAVQHPFWEWYRDDDNGDALYGFNHALRFVPTDRADYGEIARLAVQHDRGSPIWYYWCRRGGPRVPEIDGPTYQELSHVPTDRADYGEIAKLAVQTHGSSLKYVPTDRDDYVALARMAIRNDPRWALSAVPTDRDDYSELAKYAINHSPDALRGVPRDHADYAALRAVHVARWPENEPEEDEEEEEDEDEDDRWYDSEDEDDDWDKIMDEEEEEFLWWWGSYEYYEYCLDWLDWESDRAEAEQRDEGWPVGHVARVRARRGGARARGGAFV